MQKPENHCARQASTRQAGSYQACHWTPIGEHAVCMHTNSSIALQQSMKHACGLSIAEFHALRMFPYVNCTGTGWHDMASYSNVG